MFDGAKQKIERAEYHIADLERQFAAFVATKPHRYSIHTDAQTRRLSIRVQIVENPSRSLSLVIGDALHNLRTALDHMMWELVGYDGGTQHRQLSFPTGGNRINFESSCQGIKTPSQWVKDTIKSTETFEGGKGHDLYQLSQLDNSDKHTVIIPVLRATSYPPLKMLAPDGRVVGNIGGGVSVGGADRFAVHMTVPPGFSLKLDDDAQCSPSIFITNPSGVRPLPVIPTLRQFSLSVATAISGVEAAIPP